MDESFQMINLSGNFLDSIDELGEERRELESLFLSFNEIRHFTCFSQWFVDESLLLSPSILSFVP